MHFETLWEKCEDFHKKSESSRDTDTSTVLDELMLKVNVYKVIVTKSEMPQEELQKVKSRTLGEILLTLTHLSLKEDINVFDALTDALKYRLVDHFDQKYST